jgi:hypothetical protein
MRIMSKENIEITLIQLYQDYILFVKELSSIDFGDRLLFINELSIELSNKVHDQSKFYKFITGLNDVLWETKDAG